MKYLLYTILFFTGFYSFSQTPNDCVNYLQICGNQSLSFDVSGYGNTEEIYGRGCSSNENNSLWIRVSIETAGTLGFTLKPESTDINEDYDFWVFGPNASCNNLGYSIRCSTTNPWSAGQTNNWTGMNGTSTDTSEGPGPNGDSFVRWLDVAADQTYFIVIDRPIGNSAFTLEWTGTAEIKNPLDEVDIETNIPEVEICDKGNDGVETFDFSSLDTQIMSDLNGIEITYYSSESDATIKNDPLDASSSISSGTFWARVENIATGCFTLVSFPIELSGFSLNTPIYYGCLEGSSISVDLTQLDIVDSPSDYTFSYYTSEADALNENTNTIATPTAYTFSSDETIYVLVKNDSCSDVGEIQLKAITPPSANDVEEEFCINDLSGNQIDLTQFNSTISSDGDTFTFYQSTTITTMTTLLPILLITPLMSVSIPLL